MSHIPRGRFNQGTLSKPNISDISIQQGQACPTTVLKVRKTPGIYVRHSYITETY